MPYKGILLAGALLVISVGGAGFLLLKDNNSGFSWQYSEAEMPTQPLAPRPAAHESFEDTEDDTQSAPEANPMGFMLARVADQYEQSIRYPSWSIPLNPGQAQGYQGNTYSPLSLPLGDSGQFVVTLDKFRFTRGESILVIATITGPQVAGRTLQATLSQPETASKVDATDLTIDGTSGYYEGVLSSDHEPGEYRLIVEARIDGSPVRHVSTLTIEPFLGEFKGLGDTYVEGNNLIIPVKFDAEQSGFYSLSAQLYAGATPVAQLQAEKQLDGSSDTFKLRAHGTVLANLDPINDFSIRYLQLRQMPARPGDRTNYGYGPEDGYSFTPPDLESLQDTPAVNPESEQRAALLKRLADKF